MDDKQLGDFFGPFATSIRELMLTHPKTGKKTSPSTLASVLGTSTQTISYYINGKRKPSYDNILALADYFGVSTDYLIRGVSSKNLDIHKRTGLTDKAIEGIEYAKEISHDPDSENVIGVLNELLADQNFYTFIVDSIERVNGLSVLESMDEIELWEKYPNVNMISYSRWCLVQSVNEFIYMRLKKWGLNIDIL